MGALFRKTGPLSLLLVTVLPLLLGFGYAFLYSLGLTGLLDSGFTLKHWTHGLSDGQFWQSLGYSLYIAAITMALTLILALALTLKLGEALRRGAPSYLVYWPLAFPAIVSAFLTFQLFSDGGFAARVAFQLGAITSPEQFPDLVNDAAGIGIIAAHVFLDNPFFVILFGNLMESERIAELNLLARTLGAGSGQALRRVAVPVLLNRAMPTIILYFIFVLGSYEIPLLLGRQSPEMVSVMIVRKLQRFNLLDIPRAYMIACCYILFVSIFLWLSFRVRKRWVDGAS